MFIGNAKDAADLFEPLFEEAKGEKLVIAWLDARRRLIALAQEISPHKDEVELPVRTIIAEALRLGARFILLAHNHPSGSPEPSKADIAQTRKLVLAAEAVEVKLADHIIFAGSKRQSLRDSGLL